MTHVHLLGDVWRRKVDHYPLVFQHRSPRANSLHQQLMQFLYHFQQRTPKMNTTLLFTSKHSNRPGSNCSSEPKPLPHYLTNSLGKEQNGLTFSLPPLQLKQNHLCKKNGVPNPNCETSVLSTHTFSIHRSESEMLTKPGPATDTFSVTDERGMFAARACPTALGFLKGAPGPLIFDHMPMALLLRQRHSQY